MIYTFNNNGIEIEATYSDEEIMNCPERGITNNKLFDIKILEEF